jgi:hypothetical protein
MRPRYTEFPLVVSRLRLPLAVAPVVAGAAAIPVTCSVVSGVLSPIPTLLPEMFPTVPPGTWRVWAVAKQAEDRKQMTEDRSKERRGSVRESL